MKNLLAVIVCCIALLAIGNANADTIKEVFDLGNGTATYTFQTYDLMLMDHDNLYWWGIDWNLPEGRIANAKLTLYGIDNLREPEDGDLLAVRLLDKPDLGLGTLNDNQSRHDQWKWDETSDGYQKKPGFGKDRPFVGSYTDNNGLLNLETVTFNFDQPLLDKLNQFVKNDSKFGFGLDPDCQYILDRNYYLDLGMKFEATVVPEPGTLLLIGSSMVGMMGLGFRRRRRS